MADVKVPSARNKYFRKATLQRTDGTDENIWDGVVDIRATWGYRAVDQDIQEDEIPIYHAGPFRGELSGTMLGSSDTKEEWSADKLQELDGTTGDFPEFTFSLKEIDAATPTTKTWTIKAIVDNYETSHASNDPYTRVRFHAFITALPTVA